MQKISTPIRILGQIGSLVSIAAMIIPWRNAPLHQTMEMVYLNGLNELYGIICFMLIILYYLLLNSRIKWAVIPASLCLLIAIVRLIQIMTSTNRINESLPLDTVNITLAGIGWGIYLLIIGSVTMLVASAFLFRKNQSIS
ncbi:MAG: hypothetical protein LC101_11980 [Flavobacteriales bacterium]|nr:hypothetical protein [Flavobacteriales bacterium]MCZ2444482.1 hypothetical protein [Flavobacteriales bacterium]